ncbi:DUF4190 domain-containing protein [Saccharopolyspora mangrovi]|uniref:DUF4190 domain-containing protein n=1 Tax=Saccharopolyspora mangrovi TaxID=3082379 RepID=A0ABU6A2W8_9PSEU|nr:DUF4190 domain-containing protein [Saccharopolyspora sp. S2-29]MEB3365893.1 DUF4190 domain-containing protein [Saccharopolyspora sp. S2-29]
MAQPVPPLPPAPQKNGFGIAALVLAIIALVFSWIPFIGFVLSALAIVFGALAVRRAHVKIAGNKVMSYFGLALGVVAFVISIVAFASVMSTTSTSTAPPALESGAEVTNHAFGGTATWSGGEQIRVSEPQPVSSENPYLGPADGKRWVAVDVTVTNGGTGSHDVVSTAFTAQHSGRVAQEAYMSDQNDALPQTALAPGQSVSFTKVFEIESSPGDLQLSVKPNAFASTTAYFNGAA